MIEPLHEEDSSKPEYSTSMILHFSRREKYFLIAEASPDRSIVKSEFFPKTRRKRYRIQNQRPPAIK
jgi:hypothetical protein